jgi:hypothetical protein
VSVEFFSLFLPAFADLASAQASCIIYAQFCSHNFEMCTLSEGVFGVINCFCCCGQEAEWLRGALHQWLDDEYCPEPANEEISRRCAKVYYYCLLEEQVDIGDILMQMVRDLETFSFKESFHGAFSSANAAIELITKRMDQMDSSSSIQQSSSSS